jgi:signal transduction histidine kinase
VYDLKGKIIADGSNADNIGRRMYNAQDEDGVYYIQDLLKRATKEGIWDNAKIRGAFQSTYVQRIDLGIAQYVIACSYYPVSKPEMMTLLVQSGASYLKANPREKAFAEFVKIGGKFQRGDLKLTVVDTMGLCYAYGDDVDLIWRNIFKAKDDNGRPFIKMFINEAQQGPSVIKTKLNRDEKTNFVVSTEKEGKTYIVASGYYQ